MKGMMIFMKKTVVFLLLAILLLSSCTTRGSDFSGFRDIVSRFSAENSGESSSETERTTSNTLGLFASKDKKAFVIAQEAYEELCSAADLTISVMSSIYGAWYFGIYKSKDSSSSIMTDLAMETKLSVFEIKAGADSLVENYFVSESTLQSVLLGKNDDIKSFQYCTAIVDEAYRLNGVFDEIQECISAAYSALKTMTADYDDYKHYPTLKEFYAKVSSYAEFADNTTGSFEQLKTTMTDYENSIRTYRSDLAFVFD